MTWVLSAAPVLAGWLLVVGICRRADRRVLEALGGRSTPESTWRRALSHRPLVLAAVGLAVGGTVALADRPTALLAAPVLAVAGYRLPTFLAGRAARAHRAEVAATVPDLLDVVAVSVTAGLSPRLSLERATEAVGGPLRMELSAILREVSLGGTWRAGLRKAAERVDAPELRRLAVVIEQGQRLGSPVADRLRSLARDVRAERRSRREERARRAPVAMLFPLVFLILPAFVLAAVVPAVLVALRGVA